VPCSSRSAANRVGHDREVAEAQESIFSSPRPSAGRVVELRDDGHRRLCRVHTGMWSVIVSALMMTPAACTPGCRISPSMPRAVSMTCLISASAA